MAKPTQAEIRETVKGYFMIGLAFDGVFGIAQAINIVLRTRQAMDAFLWLEIFALGIPFIYLPACTFMDLLLTEKVEPVLDRVFPKESIEGKICLIYIAAEFFSIPIGFVGETVHMLGPWRPGQAIVGLLIFIPATYYVAAWTTRKIRGLNGK